MTITDSNLVPVTAQPKAGQRVIQIAPGKWIPVGLGGKFPPTAGASSDSAAGASSDSVGSQDLDAYVVQSNSGVLYARKLKFNGAQASDSQTIELLSDSAVLIFNTGHPEPTPEPEPTPSPVTSMDFYKCTYVSSDSSMTWSGYKAVFNGQSYELESDATTGLRYTTIKPTVNNIYSQNALVAVKKLYMHSALPQQGLIFYAPLDAYKQQADTQQVLQYTGGVTFQTIAGVPCGKFYSNMINFSAEGFPSNQVTISAWYYQAPSAGDATGFFGYGGGGGRVALLQNSGGIFCLQYDGGRVYSGVSIGPNGFWYHLAAVIGTSSVLFYINGQLVATKSYSANINPRDGMIGGLNGAYMCSCYIAGARIYNRQLTADQIAALATEFTPTA